MNKILRTAALAALTLAASFSHAADKGTWISTASGCMVFESGPVAQDLTASWTGHCSDGYADGKGVLSWSNGNRYEGELQVGKINGSGTFYWSNGDWYEGQFKNGRREGIGTQHYGCSGYYHGQFHNGVMDGLGVLNMADGNHYAGSFSKGVAEGLGIRNFADGSRYQGKFKDNQEEGLGTLFLANNARYEGEFKHDQPDGHALVTDPSDNVYEGTYAEGHVDGYGILTKPNGERDVGTFKDRKGTVRLVSNLGPSLYEPCQTHCSETTPSCSNVGLSGINPDDPNYQMKVTNASVDCGRDIEQCVTSCQKYNPTVRELKGIVEIGEVNGTMNSSSTSSAAHDAKPADAKMAENKTALSFADEQAAATSELRARLEEQSKQLQTLQHRIDALPRAAAATADCQSSAHPQK